MSFSNALLPEVDELGLPHEVVYPLHETHPSAAPRNPAVVADFLRNLFPLLICEAKGYERRHLEHGPCIRQPMVQPIVLR